MPGNVEILRNDAPRCAVLKDAGWRIVGTSWGARLHLCEDDWPRLGRLVSRVEGLGYQVIELSSADAEAVHALEGLTQPDYPRDGPATAHPLLSEAEVTSLFDRGRVFGVGQDCDLVAVTATHREADFVETDFTSVHPQHRHLGVAQGLKAASVLAWMDAGWLVFPSGGSGINDASVAMNAAVGYRVTEMWHTYARPR